MRLLPLLSVLLLLLPGCSLQKRIDKVSANIAEQYADVHTWETLPVRTISWNQAVAMMKNRGRNFEDWYRLRCFIRIIPLMKMMKNTLF